MDIVKEHNGYEFWNNGQDREGRDHWTIKKDGSIMANLVTITTREKREDWSGEKAYRIATRTDVTAEMRVTWKRTIKMGGFHWWEGPVTTVRRFIDAMTQEAFQRSLVMEMEKRAKAAGAPEWRLMEAAFSDRPVQDMAALMETVGAFD